MQKGKASIYFERPPVLLAAASIVGEKEGNGPLAQCFDRIEPDPMLGKASWEEAESELQRQTAKMCLQKAGIKEEITPNALRYFFGVKLVENGIDIRAVQMVMGYKDFGISKKYMGVGTKDMIDSYRRKMM